MIESHSCVVDARVGVVRFFSFLRSQSRQTLHEHVAQGVFVHLWQRAARSLVTYVPTTGKATRNSGVVGGVLRVRQSLQPEYRPARDLRMSRLPRATARLVVGQAQGRLFRRATSRHRAPQQRFIPGRVFGRTPAILDPTTPSSARVSQTTNNGLRLESDCRKTIRQLHRE